MGDATDPTLDVNIWNEDGTECVGVVDNRLLVSSQPPSAGPGETSVAINLIGAYSGSNNDVFYTITSGKTLSINFLSVSGEANGKGMKFSLYEDPNGDASVLNIIPQADIITDGFPSQRSISVSFSGDGTRRILLRLNIL